MTVYDRLWFLFANPLIYAHRQFNGQSNGQINGQSNGHGNGHGNGNGHGHGQGHGHGNGHGNGHGHGHGNGQERHGNGMVTARNDEKITATGRLPAGNGNEEKQKDQLYLKNHLF
jgi:hypothetical protein